MAKRIFIGCLFLILTLASLFIWLKFSYPQFSFVDLSVDQATALKTAEQYLSQEHKIPTAKYQKAVVFTCMLAANRYLQRAIGFEGERDFIHRHHFDLFLWMVRFFKENQKEEFRLAVSAATGKIISFSHIINDTAAREPLEEEEAQRRATDFLKDHFQLNPDDYTFESKHSRKYDNRTDYSFTWQKNNVYIPWSHVEGSGSARLLMGATVSGNEILAFSKDTLDIPEKFNRVKERQISWGNNLYSIFRILYLILLTAATFFVVARRNHLVMHMVKKFFVGTTASLLILSILFFLTQYGNILFDYPTTSSMTTYLWNYVLETTIPIFILAVTVLMPGLGGESIHYEVFPEKKRGRFLHYVSSTFFSRDILRSIFLGYITCIIMVGIQSILFAWGQRYVGVWIEHSWLTQISTSSLPFLAAFVIGFRASVIEEITFRLFAISWLKKLTRSAVLAALISSVMWGYGHSLYLVFPMWFRGIEVTCLGIFLSIIYLSYGIIPVLVAHYAFDVFWNTSGFLLGKSNPLYFYSSLSVLFLPLLFGLIAFLVNKSPEERPLRWRLNKHQLYNLEILKTFLAQKGNLSNLTAEQLRKELIDHGWDVSVVEAALDFRKT